MYAQELVDQRIGIVEEETGRKLEYHSVQEVKDFAAYLNKKYEREYEVAENAAMGSKEPAKTFQLEMLRQLTDPSNPRLGQEELRWFENEKSLVQCDAAYWLTRYYYIKTPAKIKLFTFLPGQRVYFDVIAEMEKRRAPIEMIVNKARQHGISTETEGLICHASTFTYGANCVIASANREMAAKMSQMTFLGYDMMPWWMKPVYTRRVESQQGMLTFGSLRSAISVQHGNQMSAIARGDTVLKYHLSECASYGDPVALIEAGLFRCVHPHPSVFGILESTAEGDRGWWYDTYWQARREWARGGSRLCPLFLPWFLGTDKYPTPTWRRTHPIPSGWRPMLETRQMTARARLYVRSNPILEKVLGKGWELPPHQQWYWEVHYLEHKSKGIEKTWFQEMPTDDVESFQGSYESVFGREVIAEVFTKRETKYAVFGIVGEAIEEKHEPDTEEIDYGLPREMVRWTSKKGQRFSWELVPMKFEEEFTSLDTIGRDERHPEDGKLIVWEFPKEGEDYSIGVDTSSGIGSDSTAIEVVRRGRENEPDVQVAEFVSDSVSHVEAYAFVAAIAAWYATAMRGGQFTQPYLSIEQVAAVGDTCQLQLRKMGFWRFHKMTRYDGKKVSKKQATKFGWFTWGWSRPILTDGFVVAVQNGWLIVNSPWLAYEMSHWEVHLTAGGKERKEHSEDECDDRIFACAMATFCPNDLKLLVERSKRRPDPIDLVKPQISFGDWEGEKVGIKPPEPVMIGGER